MAGLLVLVLFSSVGAAQNLDRTVGLPLLVNVPTAPIPVRADGKYRLVYELHLTNAGSEPVNLLRAEVWASSKLATVQGEALRKAIKPTGSNQSQQPSRIGPGLHVVIMFWLTLDEVPASVTHRLQGTVGDDLQPLTLESPGVPVRGSPVRLRPPLRGERWVAVEGPSNDTHHRRSWLSFNGRAFAPERFAIDFVRVYENGALTRGDPADNHSWAGYGAEAVAVMDARVASVTDGVPDTVPANRRAAAPATLEALSGNAVVLDLGNGRYAFYLHLQPGSLRVKPGDRVHAGQVLGLVGNSGNTNGTHLHFQVSDGPSFLLSDGVPYVFDAFDHESAEFSGDELRLSGSRSPRRNEIPLQNWVVHFP